jgi:hypothetical protein
VFVRVPAQTFGARWFAGTRGRVVRRVPLGGGNGRGRLFRLDSALGVDVRGRGAGQRSASARAAARVSACGRDGAGLGPAAGHRQSAGRGGLPVARQRLPAPAGPGMAWRLRNAGPLCRRRAGDVPVPGAGGGRAGAADRAARRARPAAEAGQNQDCAAERGQRGSGLGVSREPCKPRVDQDRPL